ncbi:hypothetical protein [Streptomyces paromomycinus]|uniref:Uncharacterized protein n=1 Tax=Streptomyces paromomycinus TaxID=92743 RepID=A0A401VXR0_STREY|nr:hypothetical protein [Streptomyces paromomycinus]GCD41857.1 hypothetical protein GKJPGBOP_01514 [Streptomyces paromomycinus]
MKPDIQHHLIPREDVLRLIGALNPIEAKCSESAQKWQLLDESGHMPAAPSFTELFQHATETQNLSRDAFRLTGDFAANPHSTTRAGRATLVHLAMASTTSAHAASHFSDTAEAALYLPVVSRPTDQHYLENRMVLDHASARAYLRRTSEAMRDALKELNGHLDSHRSFPAPSRQQSPAPPPPGLSGRHR